MNNNKKQLEMYNRAYRFATPDFLASENLNTINQYLAQNNDSILRFVKNFFEERGELERLPSLKILDLGCGLGGLSHQLNEMGCRTHGIDISPLAIYAAEEISRLKGSDATFEVLDVTKRKNLNREFDLVIDSHLLHCLTSEAERSNYFTFVKNHLSDSGILLVETATFDDAIREPLGFDLDESYILHQELSGEMLPVRKLAKSIDLEKEIIENGLEINTFFYHFELSMNVFPNVKNYPSFRLPKTVRYSAKKP